MNKKYLITLTTLGFIVSILKTEGSEDKIAKLAAAYEAQFNREQEKVLKKRSKELALKDSERQQKSQPTSPSAKPASPLKVTSPMQKPTKTEVELRILIPITDIGNATTD